MRRRSSMKLPWEGTATGAGGDGGGGAGFAMIGAATGGGDGGGSGRATETGPAGAPCRYAVMMVVCVCRTCFMSCWNCSITASLALDDGMDGGTSAGAGTITGDAGGMEERRTRSSGWTICGGWL